MGSRLFPSHGGYQRGRGLVSAVPAESLHAAFSTRHPVKVNKPEQLSPFDKMCLLVREKKAKPAGTASKSELGELLCGFSSHGENRGTRIQATQQIPSLNMN